MIRSGCFWTVTGGFDTAATFAVIRWLKQTEGDGQAKRRGGTVGSATAAAVGGEMNIMLPVYSCLCGFILQE